MSVPEPEIDLLDTDLANAVRRTLPLITQWLNGNGPAYHALELPYIVRTGAEPLIAVAKIDRCPYYAPAPWAERVYRYVTQVALVGDVVVAYGEWYRVFDWHATFMASVRGR